MRNILADRYEDLTLEERCNATAQARQAAIHAARSDEDGSFADDDQTVRTVEPSIYFRDIIEPAWQSGQIDDLAFQAWKEEVESGDIRDPRALDYAKSYNKELTELADVKSEIRFLVITNGGEHSGFVQQVDMRQLWTGSNPSGWTNQDVEGPHGCTFGEYDTREEALEALDKYLECDAETQGTYCYSHNQI